MNADRAFGDAREESGDGDDGAGDVTFTQIGGDTIIGAVREPGAISAKPA